MWKPLAAKLRPKTMDDYVGQSHLMSKGKPIRHSIEHSHFHSMIFWGPPGSGKTTLAELIAYYANAEFLKLSAVLAGVADIRNAVKIAKENQKEKKITLLFIDEIHRFNKTQQDALLPFVEDGTIILIGATTENPSFEIINPLLSRCRVYVLKPLNAKELEEIIQHAFEKDSELKKYRHKFTDKILARLIQVADGDARRLLNILEVMLGYLESMGKEEALTDTLLETLLQQDYRKFDKGGDVFYEQISALHKSVRGSSPDGAIYWLCRMLDGGCDPIYIARRLVRMAIEDIGLADPRALTLAVEAWQAYERLGSPEGELALAQVALYLAACPKSVAGYDAYNGAMQDVRKMPSYEVPVHLRNAPTKLMKDLSYGKAYRYDPQEPGGFSAGQTYFPDEMGERQYYFPAESGLEQKIADKLELLRSNFKRKKQ
jgi:putative ATPase